MGLMVIITVALDYSTWKSYEEGESDQNTNGVQHGRPFTPSSNYSTNRNIISEQYPCRDQEFFSKSPAGDTLYAKKLALPYK